MQEKIHRAAIKLIARHGYEAMTLRMLAKDLGLKAPSLYNHVASKQDLLFDIIKSTMEDFLDYMAKGLEGISDPIERLSRFIELNVRYDCLHADAVFVGKNETRSLTKNNMQIVQNLTNQYRQMLLDILMDGAEKKKFSTEPPHMIAYAIMAMLTGISTWFKPSKTSSLKEVQKMCQVLVLRMVRA